MVQQFKIMNKRAKESETGPRPRVTLHLRATTVHSQAVHRYRKGLVRPHEDAARLLHEPSIACRR